ncbi:MAG: hypothetical protein SFU27_06305 [Thermonemataceae bacterium]|nr:hypothetical protein [Thermonemataceae bacterium]
MILYYAVGGGLGHLARASAVIHTLEIPKNEIFVLTASPFAKIYFEDLPILQLPAYLQKEAQFYEIWLHQQIKKYQFSEIWVDSFPAGILGELRYLAHSEVKWVYLARLLDWEAYRHLLYYIPDYQKVFLLEKLEEAHQNFVDSMPCTKEKLLLRYPMPDFKQQLFTEKDWLIVHSEPQEEIEELLAYAQDQAQMEKKDADFHIISPLPSFDTTIYCQFHQIYPAYPYFEQAGKIFTAAGFNSMQQSIYCIEKHHYLPFRRRFDNQFFRASQRKFM